MFKVGDKVYCIKNSYSSSDNLLLFKKSNLYSIYDITIYNNIISILYDNDCHYAFWFKSKMKEYDFDTYFCDLKKLRKEKIENIIKECQ